MSLKNEINDLLSDCDPAEAAADIITLVAEWLEERGHYESTFKLFKEAKRES